MQKLPYKSTTMSNKDYHKKDPKNMTVSSSMLRDFQKSCPKAFWWKYNNPSNERKQAFDIGTAAHSFILQKDKFLEDVVVTSHDSYKTKAAQQERDNAIKAGKAIIKQSEFNEFKYFEESLFKHELASSVLNNGMPEVSFFWEDKETGLTCKARPDYVNPHYLVDYKTTTDASKEAFIKSFFDFGYHQQAAWYIDGVGACGYGADQFVFVVQEKEPPYLVNVFAVSEKLIEVGRKLNRISLLKLNQCYRRNEWQGYANESVEIIELEDIKPWTRYKYEEIGVM